MCVVYYIFRHLKLEIALAIPASNDEKYAFYCMSQTKSKIQSLGHNQIKTTTQPTFQDCATKKRTLLRNTDVMLPGLSQFFF